MIRAPLVQLLELTSQHDWPSVLSDALYHRLGVSTSDRLFTEQARLTRVKVTHASPTDQHHASSRIRPPLPFSPPTITPSLSSSLSMQVPSPTRYTIRQATTPEDIAKCVAVRVQGKLVPPRCASSRLSGADTTTGGRTDGRWMVEWAVVFCGEQGVSYPDEEQVAQEVR